MDTQITLHGPCKECEHCKKGACYHFSNLILDHYSGKWIPKWGINILNYDISCNNHEHKIIWEEKLMDWWESTSFHRFYKRLVNEIQNSHDRYKMVMNRYYIIEPEELFSLDASMCRWFIPRLEALRAIQVKKFDMTDDPEYLPKLDYVIMVLKEIDKDAKGVEHKEDSKWYKEHLKRKKIAFKYLENIFFGLWW